MDISREFAATPPREPLTYLGAIIRDWKWRIPKERRDQVVEHCRTAPNLSAAIALAVASRGPDGKMHNHQTRVPKTAKASLTNTLLDNRVLIRIAANFDELYDLIEFEAQAIFGVSTVTTYDVATRIGAYLGHEPESLYLHAGVLKGWMALARVAWS